MSWFWTVIFLSFTFCSNFSEAKHQKKLPSAVVVGTVYCDTCFQQNFPKANHFIAGASVEVQCKETSSRQGFLKEVKTNNHGEFKIHLPFSVSKHVNKIRGCSIRLIRSNEPFCAVAATATSSSLHLKSRIEGTHIFSAGFFSFKPLKQPQVCDQKPNIKNLDQKKLSRISSNKKEIDQLPFLPNPLNPPSIFPPNPLLPPPSILPPLNPFQPPPSIIPPIFPTPPPSIFPPIFPTPPTPPFFHLPPIPGLVPSPPPPSPPTFPIPLPPFPFQPTPGFPGVPPAQVSSHSRTSYP